MKSSSINKSHSTIERELIVVEWYQEDKNLMENI